jgi:hypothetical protein
MKKLATILTAVTMLFTVTAFAGGDTKITARIKEAFEKDFLKATNVSWEKTKEYYFATFTFNDRELNAVYNEEGELIGTSRKIAYAQLPLSVSLSLSQKYGDYQLPEQVTELNYNGETHYLLTVSNAKKILQLNLRPNGEVTVDKKIKKQ